MRKKKKMNPRVVFLIVLLLAVFIIFGVRLADFQIINTEGYATVKSNQSSFTTTLSATRGEILDRYGRALVKNREGYDVTVNKAYMNDGDLNGTILELIDLFKDAGVEWTDNLPMSPSAPFGFNPESERSVSSLKANIELNDYATAENCFEEMVLRYDLQGYNKEVQRQLMGVRYSMERSGFSLNTPFTMAKDIPTDLMSYIKESMSSVPGVQIVVSTYREYSNGTVAPHLLGTVGKIYAEQWEELKAKGYKYSDLIGKSGIEAVYEDYLRGKDGKLAYCFDDDGRVVSTEIVEQPIQGNTVMLSIDKKVQTAAQSSLQNAILEANAKGGVVTGGSAVVVDIDTAEILASVNYPYFDLNSYSEDFSRLSKEKNKPLFDRAFNGVYPPGSAFKPLVAIAALNNNIITKDECINCVGTYRYYPDFRPSCMKVHRNQNVINALSNSCNYFFFDVGRRLGIEKITQYAKGFGLGEKTGVEIDESAGVLAGPEHSKEVGSVWYGGNVVQAAIGQSDNSFTPLQLAMYMTTIVNKGTRYKASLLNQIRSYNLEEIVLDYKPEVLNKVNINDSVIDIVKQGMLSVTEEGTARRFFSDYSIKVGGKTGTAENPGADHATFIAFAPYDDPKIAVAIVVEHGEYSTTTVPVAKAIFDAYFLDVSDSYVEPPANTLIQ